MYRPLVRYARWYRIWSHHSKTEIMKAKLKYLNTKIRRYGLIITVANIIANKASKFLPDVLMNPIYEYKHKLIKRQLMTFVSSFIADNGMMNYTKEDNQSQKMTFKKEPIWVCWLQGEENMPELVKTCYKSILKFSGEHQVVLITLDNLKNYVNIDERIIKRFEKGVIKAAAFSDIIRLNLLFKYGGVWLDATIYCTSIIDERLFQNDFQSIGTRAINKRFVANGRWCVFMIGSHSLSNSIYSLKTIYEAYLIKEDCMIDYLLIDYIIDLFCSMKPDFRNTLMTFSIYQPDVMSLMPLLNKKFEPEVWARMTRHTQFFKLSWKDFSDKELKGFDKDTYYAHLKNLVKI